MCYVKYGGIEEREERKEGGCQIMFGIICSTSDCGKRNRDHISRERQINRAMFIQHTCDTGTSAAWINACLIGK